VHRSLAATYLWTALSQILPSKAAL
jgi:hypothetical protein